METESSTSAGFLDSVRTLAHNLLGTVHDRIELISVELQEEKNRLIKIFVWISAAIFTGMMTIAFASITVVYLFWESARLAVLGGITLFYALALATILIAFRRFIRNQPRAFEATIQEIKHDRACIRTRN